MKKNTIIALLIVTLAVGLYAGFQLGESRGFYGGWRGDMFQGKRMMKSGYMMGDNNQMDMTKMMGKMSMSLQGKTGDDFDQAFLSEMIVHHEGAVEMANMALANAKHQEIKTLAAAIIAAQNKEITSMKAWLSTWYSK